MPPKPAGGSGRSFSRCIGKFGEGLVRESHLPAGVGRPRVRTAPSDWSAAYQQISGHSQQAYSAGEVPIEASANGSSATMLSILCLSVGV